MVLYTLFYTIYSVKLCSIDSNNGLSLNSAESLNSAKKHYFVPISLSLNSAVSLNSAKKHYFVPISLSLNSAVSLNSAAILNSRFSKIEFT